MRRLLWHHTVRAAPEQIGGAFVRKPLADVQLRLDPTDLRIGVFWSRETRPVYVVMLALLPMLVIRISWFGKAARR